MRYLVEYQDADQLLKSDSLVADNPGSAFAKCQKNHPGAHVLKAKCYGRAPLGGEGWTEYDAPKVQREPVPEPKELGAPPPEDHSCSMPFYDEVKGEKKA